MLAIQMTSMVARLVFGRKLRVTKRLGGSEGSAVCPGRNLTPHQVRHRGQLQHIESPGADPPSHPATIPLAHEFLMFSQFRTSDQHCNRRAFDRCNARRAQRVLAWSRRIACSASSSSGQQPSRPRDVVARADSMTLSYTSEVREVLHTSSGQTGDARRAARRGRLGSRQPWARLRWHAGAGSQRQNSETSGVRRTKTRRSCSLR